MRRFLLVATSLLSLAVIDQSALAAEAPYIDDRSSAEAVIRSLYSAISRHEFARAWGYFGDTKPAKDFDAFAKGYDNTATVEVKTGTVSNEGAAGSIYYSVPVAVQAHQERLAGPGGPAEQPQRRAVEGGAPGPEPERAQPPSVRVVA